MGGRQADQARGGQPSPEQEPRIPGALCLQGCAAPSLIATVCMEKPGRGYTASDRVSWLTLLLRALFKSCQH